jgi:hypothetical protein
MDRFFGAFGKKEHLFCPIVSIRTQPAIPFLFFLAHPPQWPGQSNARGAKSSLRTTGAFPGWMPSFTHLRTSPVWALPRSNPSATGE